MAGFLGTPTGGGTFVQTTYPNQMGSALPGDLANASDLNLIDSMPVSDVNGIGVGLAAFVQTLTPGTRPGANDIGVIGANANCVARNFWGVTVRGQAGFADASGVPIWPYQKMAPIARPHRAGCRIWVYCNDTVAQFDLVYVVIANAHQTRKIGSFTNAGTLSGDAVLIANAQFMAAATAGDGKALVEFRGLADASNVPTSITTTTTTSTTTTT